MIDLIAAVTVRISFVVVHDNSKSFSWSKRFTPIVEKIVFFAKENASTTLLCQLLVAAFNIKSNTAVSFSLVLLIDLTKVFEDSLPMEGFSFFLCKSTLGAVGLGHCTSCKCLIGMGGGLIASGDGRLNWLQ